MAQYITKWDPQAVIKMARDVSAENMTEACEFVAEEMRKRVPKRTGKLRDSIGYEVRISEDGDVEGVVGVTKKSKRGYIARFLELGTVKMPARPFMRPAVFDNARTILRILRGKGK